MSGLPDRHRVLYLVDREQVELRTEALRPPGPGEMVVAIDAATTCGTDLKVYLRGGHPRMLQPPCPFGHEMAGTVRAVGPAVRRWHPGQRVVVANSASCGRCPACVAGRENLCRDLQYLNGAFAEHVVVPKRFVERSTYALPDGLDPAVAAMAEPLACVLHGIESVDLTEVAEAVVIGGGPIGQMFVAELARRGIRVVLADPVPGRLETAQHLGAAETVRALGDTGDYARLAALTQAGDGADLVVEATGVPLGWSNGMRSVRPGGTVLLFGGCAPGTHVACDSHRIHYSEITVKGVYHHRPTTFTAALDHLARGAPDLSSLISEERPLDGVELALQRMAERRILKAVVRPTPPAQD